ncbi:putative Transferase, transferring glycosyl groups [Quillaja saponaria]|uniref:Transferase, transferring glycosyl groups n=1 Tax=Quillaja saponaria TaxID=32244 RepID=A0AAD7PMS7_QUISA|nr:putative Transferase, transferring glycosyl groups [Quillaja saponaria]
MEKLNANQWWDPKDISSHSFFSLYQLFFFYSYYHSSLPPSTTSSNPNFTFNNPLHTQNPNSNTPNFTFVIKVLAFNRLDSVSRCLRSLANADYLGDRVHLHVYIDHFAHENGSIILDKKLNESHRILEFVDGFDWRFGEKLVHYRTGNVGLQAQWLEAWWPSSDNEFAFIVEDDLEVSFLYYEFVKSLIVNFYYNASNLSPSIYGVSLQRPRFVPGKHGNKIQLDNQTRLFLYQLVGTWGQILFPKPWKEFRLWYDEHKAKGIKPFLEGMVTTGWYKKMGERIWTPWDAGVNYGKTAGPDSQLIDDNSLDFNLLEMQPLSNLKWYDFCFRELLPGRVVRNFNELESVLYSLQKQNTVIIVNIFGASEMSSMKEILMKAYVVRKCIEHGINCWVVDGGMLFVSSDMLLESVDPNHDFFAVKNLELFYARSSPFSKKIWVDNFISEVAAMVFSLAGKVSSSSDGLRFVYIVEHLLEHKGVKIKRFDETNFVMKIGIDYC